MKIAFSSLRNLAFLIVVMLLALSAMAETPKLGIVIMHGKGGSPARHVAGLADALAGKGYLVANLEMPWSGNRNYDADVAAAESQIETALSDMRGKGAKQVFVAGHSQGGVFALHIAGRLAVDGVICIAPGGDVGNRVFREKLGDSLARAKQLVAAGKGDKKVSLEDYEGNKGSYAIEAAPEKYLQWFDPDGAMSTKRSIRAANPKVPILWIVAKNDYPGLRKVNIPMFELLPKNPFSRLVQPDTDHKGAPSGSLDEILRWTTEIASANAR